MAVGISERQAGKNLRQAHSSRPRLSGLYAILLRIAYNTFKYFLQEDYILAGNIQIPVISRFQICKGCLGSWMSGRWSLGKVFDLSDGSPITV